MKRHSGIIARLRVHHAHECQVGLNSETNLWDGNAAVEGDVWRCGECGATYVWHGKPARTSYEPGDWLRATKKELRAIETGEEVEPRDR